MAGLTKRELRAARKLGALLPRLATADIVYAVLPDSAEVLVKGRDRLDQIIASGNSRNCHVMRVPVPSLEAAVALEENLGRDGSYTQPGPVGQA